MWQRLNTNKIATQVYNSDLMERLSQKIKVDKGRLGEFCRQRHIVRLQHMVDAANEALSFIADKSKSEFKADRALALALVKSIEIFGEATSKGSRELRSQSAEIPWADIVAMRNRLIHSYFDVN